MRVINNWGHTLKRRFLNSKKGRKMHLLPMKLCMQCYSGIKKEETPLTEVHFIFATACHRKLSAVTLSKAKYNNYDKGIKNL